MEWRRIGETSYNGDMRSNIEVTQNNVYLRHINFLKLNLKQQNQGKIIPPTWPFWRARWIPLRNKKEISSMEKVNQFWHRVKIVLRSKVWGRLDVWYKEARVVSPTIIFVLKYTPCVRMGWLILIDDSIFWIEIRYCWGNIIQHSNSLRLLN